MENDPAERLSGVLRDLVDVNRRLLDVSQGKQRMLAALDLDGLQVLMSLEQQLVARRTLLEQKRANLVDAMMSGPLRRPLGTDVRLKRIIERAPVSFRPMLRGLQSELRQALRKLSESHSEGRQAARRSLQRLTDVVDSRVFPAARVNRVSSESSSFRH